MSVLSELISEKYERKSLALTGDQLLHATTPAPEEGDDLSHPTRCAMINHHEID